MIISQRKLVAIALTLLVATLTVLTFGLNPVARFVPTYVALPTLGLLLLNLGLEFMQPDTLILPVAEDKQSVRNLEARVLAWVLLLPALTFLLGLILAVLLYAYFYARRWLAWGYLHSLIASGLLASVVYTAVYFAIRGRILDGWLWSQLGLQA